jgi:hypothetical protein
MAKSKKGTGMWKRIHNVSRETIQRMLEDDTTNGSKPKPPSAKRQKQNGGVKPKS